MSYLKRSSFVALLTVCALVPSLALAATASIQNLATANPLAKTNVTFKVVPVGFSTPNYQMTDSFNGSSIVSSNLNFGGNFQWVPTTYDIGSHTITITVRDSDGNNAVVTQTINVLPPPSISITNVSPNGAIMPGTKLTFTISFPGFTNPNFIPSDTFSGSSVSNSATISSSGNFAWTPDSSQNGEHTITIYASDASGNSAYASVPVRVGSGPSIAVAPGFTGTTLSPGQTASFTLNATNFSPTAFSLFDKTSGPSSLSNANITANGVFSWTPQGTDVGVHNITITGQVGVSGMSASTTQTITVLGPGGVLPTVAATPTTTSSSNSSVSALQNQLALLQAQLGAAALTPPATPAFVFKSYLKAGSESDEVLELQKLLQKLGYLTVTPNGYFGPSTLAAVKKFQAANKLDQLGVVGPGTRAALNAALGSGATQSTVSNAGTRYVFEHFMGVGDDDPDVIELQKRLIALGFMTGEPSGFYGPATETAVKKFQVARNLEPTGYVAKITRIELNK